MWSIAEKRVALWSEAEGNYFLIKKIAGALITTAECSYIDIIEKKMY